MQLYFRDYRNYEEFLSGAFIEEITCLLQK